MAGRAGSGKAATNFRPSSRQSKGAKSLDRKKAGTFGRRFTNVREGRRAASLSIDRAAGGGSRGRGPQRSVSAAEIQSQLLPRPLSSDATETTTLYEICLRRRAASPPPVPHGGPRAGVG